MLIYGYVILCIRYYMRGEKMIIFDTTDPRQKTGVIVSRFHHVLKNKKHVEGVMIEKPYFRGEDEVFDVFNVYIRQGEKVVAFLTGIISDWSHFFDFASYRFIERYCKKRGDVLRNGFDILEKHLETFYDFDRLAYDEITSKDKWFESENGFILVDRLWVHPFYRKQGYAKTLFKVVKKKYDGGITYIMSSLPFVFEDLHSLKVKDRKINIDFFDLLLVPILDDSDGKLQIRNQKIIKQMFKLSHHIKFELVKFPLKKQYFFSIVDNGLIRAIEKFVDRAI